MPVQPKLDRLVSQLVTSGIQKDNPALYQVIEQLIKATKQLQEALNEQITDIDNSITNITNTSSLTTLSFPLDSIGSYEGSDGIDGFPGRDGLVGSAGATGLSGLNGINGLPGIDGIDGEENYSYFGVKNYETPISNGYWAPLTDGDSVEMELISNNGEAIMVFVPL